MNRALLFLVPAALAALSVLAEAKGPIYPFEIKVQHVTVVLDGNVATTKVELIVANDGTGQPEEIELLFPLPPGAVISSSRLVIEGTEVQGAVLSVGDAKAAYEEVVRRERDPSILKHVGASAYRSRVFPIPAGGERRLSLEYVMTLPYEAGVYEYRFIPWDGQLFRGAIGRQRIEVEVHSPKDLGAIYSPTHPIEVVRDGTRRATAVFDQTNVDPQGDFRLFVSLAEGRPGMELLTYRKEGEDGYFMLLGAPPAPESAQAPERNLVLVVDKSGSMRGEKWEQARRALLHALEGLRPEDRFDLVLFDHEIRCFSGGAAGAEAIRFATPEAVAAAKRFVEGLEPTGGTNLGGALSLALDEAAKAGGATEIVLISDGDPTIGERDRNRILESVSKKNAAPRARFFVFGVGDEVDIPFLDKLAVVHGGFPVFVSREDDLEARIASFYDKIRHPVLLDAKIRFEGVRTWGVYPPDLGSLYAGSQWVVLGRYSEPGSGKAILSGSAGGKERGFAYTGEFPAAASGGDFLPRLWAGRRIGYLIDELRIHGHSQEVMDEVVRLSRDYGILTEYTAFLADERDLSVEGLARKAREAFDAGGRTVRGEPARRAAMAKEEIKMMSSESEATSGSDKARSLAHEDGKTFVQTPDGVWVDVAAAAAEGGGEVETVERYGDRWFELVRSDDGLARAFGLGERVRVLHQWKIYEVK